MSSVDLSEAPASHRPSDAPEDSPIPYGLLLRWAGGLLVLLLLVAGVAHALRPQLEFVGQLFVNRFGYTGVLLGALIADGFHFPVPPQFYMLLSIAAGRSEWLTLSATILGSLAGGTIGFFVGRRLSDWGPLKKRLERSLQGVQRLHGRYGDRAAVIVSATPLAYSMLCYLAGMHRLPGRFYGILALLRVPKLVLYFYLVKFGWGLL